MNGKFVSGLALGAALLSAAPAGAAKTAPAVTATDDTNAGTKRTPYIGWAGLGLYDVSGTGAFGFHVGGAVSLISLTPDMPLIGWADAGIGFPSGGTIFPLKLGLGVRYDRAGPVQLLGGIDFAVTPNSYSGAGTPIGIGLMGSVLYPLPAVHRNLSAQLQLGYDFMNNSFGTFWLMFGAGWAI